MPITVKNCTRLGMDYLQPEADEKQRQWSLARGYIASGEFNGHRIPQHIQNQIVKSYCDANELKFVLSRAEYLINGSTDCQLWGCT